MSSWVLVPSLESLRGEINKLAPTRDKTTDGSIGDTVHQGNSSDHNDDECGVTPDEDSDNKHEVHAIDVDKDLNRSDITMQDVVDTLVARCRKDNGDPDNEPRLKYIIFNGYIWDAPGWQKVKYTGSNPHDKHAHFSAEYDSVYSEDTSPWGLIEKYGEDDVLTDADKNWIKAEIAKVAAAVWNHQEDNPESTTTPPEKGRMGGWARMEELRAKDRHTEVLAAVAALNPEDPA